MSSEQLQILGILGATIAVFLWGRWRHDIVALGSLLACVFAGLVPSAEAFAGFGHPAVITVGCVLVLSWGLQSTGAVDLLAQRVLPSSAGPTVTIAAITGLGAVLSAFMNNVGAMALLMPLAAQLARRLDLPAGKVLMPLSFGTILGGMTTLIGTPPNLIVSGFREKAGLGSFGMFDFTPAGFAVASVGVLFVAFLGWRIVPSRPTTGVESFDTGTYLTEVKVSSKSKLVGQTLRSAEQDLVEADAQIIGLVRNDFHIPAPNPQRILQAGDILVIEAEPQSLASSLSGLGLALEQRAAAPPDDRSPPEKQATEPSGGDPETQQVEVAAKDRKTGAEGLVLRELVVMPTSPLIGRSASDVQLRAQHNLSLLAISRRGMRSIKRLRTTAILASDVLLIQGSPDSLSGFATQFSCLPLAARSIAIPNKRKAVLATSIMALAIGGAAFGLFPAAISFAAGVLLFVVFGIVPLRNLYTSVDWSVIVLLGALIPVAIAMETTGAAGLLADGLLSSIAQGHPVAALAVVLIVTMTLSDFMNNAATAAVMCPIAMNVADQLEANPDAFLMAVAIGASCAFLTPIGHQNNTLILGPGGFRFSDYWKLGLPMEILVVAVGLPVLLIAWPL